MLSADLAAHFPVHKCVRSFFMACLQSFCCNKVAYIVDGLNTFIALSRHNDRDVSVHPA